MKNGNFQLYQEDSYKFTIFIEQKITSNLFSYLINVKLKRNYDKHIHN